MKTRTCFSCLRTSEKVEFYWNSSMCIDCKDEYDFKRNGWRGRRWRQIFATPPFCNVCGKPLDLSRAKDKRVYFPWLCGNCKPRRTRLADNGDACHVCQWLLRCKERAMIGLWMLCERPDIDDLYRARRRLGEYSPEQNVIIREAITKTLQHVPKRLR